MARFEHSKGRDSRSSSPRRSTGDWKGSRSSSKRDEGSYSNREPRFSSRDSNRNRHEVQMTKVTCSSCGVECEVPFKPTSNKPVYCDKCFAKKGKNSYSNNSNMDLDIINEKLDKIIKALDIE